MGDYMVYLDNAATTKPNDNVINAYLEAQTILWANPSSPHNFGEEVHFKLEETRRKIKRLLDVEDGEIYFTSSATESINTFLRGVLNPGDHLITTSYEHSAVYNVAEYLKERGVEVTVIEPKDGNILAKDVLNAIKENTRLIAIMKVNNEIGAVNDVEEIANIAKAKKPDVLVFSDYVQAVGKVKTDLKRANLNGISISPHKFHGLKGTGILYVKGVDIKPLILGGGQEMKIRSSTENVGGIFASYEALKYAVEKQEEFIYKTEILREEMLKRLSDIPDMRVNAANNNLPNILSLSFKRVKGEALVHMLEGDEIFVNTSSACASHGHKKSRTLSALGVPEDFLKGTIRISFCEENTVEEAVFAANKIKEYVKLNRELIK